MKKIFYSFAVGTALLMTGSLETSTAALEKSSDKQINTEHAAGLAKTFLETKSFHNQLLETYIPDGVYPLGYYGGIFNVGFEATIKNDEFVKVANPWYDLINMEVNRERLEIVTPTEVVYYLNVTDGKHSWDQNLHVKIIDEDFFYFFA